MESLLSLDKEAFLFLNAILANPWCDRILYFWSYLGNALVVLVLVVLFSLRSPFLKDNLLYLALALLLGGMVVNGLKELIQRPRPVAEFASLITAGKVHVHVVGAALTGNSFPSGHTQVAFSAATYLSLALPRFCLPFILLATGVAVSRISMGVHFPLDVMAGALIGAVTGWGGWRIKGIVQKRARRSEA